MCTHSVFPCTQSAFPCSCTYMMCTCSTIPCSCMTSVHLHPTTLTPRQRARDANVDEHLPKATMESSPCAARHVPMLQPDRGMPHKPTRNPLARCCIPTPLTGYSVLPPTHTHTTLLHSRCA